MAEKRSSSSGFGAINDRIAEMAENRGNIRSAPHKLRDSVTPLKSAKTTSRTPLKSPQKNREPLAIVSVCYITEALLKRLCQGRGFKEVKELSFRMGQDHGQIRTVERLEEFVALKDLDLSNHQDRPLSTS